MSLSVTDYAFNGTSSPTKCSYDTTWRIMSDQACTTLSRKRAVHNSNNFQLNLLKSEA
jgi:hypothetical protein